MFKRAILTADAAYLDLEFAVNQTGADVRLPSSVRLPRLPRPSLY